MSYLFDTCVLSQLRKNIPESVRIWFESKEQKLYFISLSSLLLNYLMASNVYPNQKKRKDLEDWFYGDIHTRFKNRIISIDDHVAKRVGFSQR